MTYVIDLGRSFRVRITQNATVRVEATTPVEATEIVHKWTERWQRDNKKGVRTG